MVIKLDEINLNEVTIVYEGKMLPNSSKMVYSDVVGEYIRFHREEIALSNELKEIVEKEGKRIAEAYKIATGFEHAVFYFVSNYHFYVVAVPF